MKLFVLLVLLPLFSFSQKRIQLSHSIGKAVQSETESLLECKYRAINNAKTNALRKAGVAENVTSYSSFFQSEMDGQYTDVFKSDVLNDINGYVIINKENSLEKALDEFGNVVVTVDLDVTVLKYKTTKDLTFNAWVSGLDQKGYLNADPVQFSIKPNQEMYVRIFDLVDQKVYPLYPNALESNQLFKKDKTYHFPTTNALQYLFEFEGDQESHNFIILFLKEDVPYTSTSNASKDLLDWIFQIEPNKRQVKTYSFDVFKQQ